MSSRTTATLPLLRQISKNWGLAVEQLDPGCVWNACCKTQRVADQFRVGWIEAYYSGKILDLSPLIHYNKNWKRSQKHSGILGKSAKLPRERKLD